MNATDEVRVENQNHFQGRNYALLNLKKITFAQIKRRPLQKVIYPPKGKQKKELIGTASGGKSRLAYRPLTTLLIQLLKKFKMQSLLQ